MNITLPTEEEIKKESYKVTRKTKRLNRGRATDREIELGRLAWINGARYVIETLTKQSLK